MFYFYKNTSLIFAQNLRTVPSSAEEKVSNFQFKLRTDKGVHKTAPSPAQLTKCILLHAYSSTTTAPSCAGTNKIFILLV